MEKGMLRTAVKNLFSVKRPAEDLAVICGKKMLMPFPDTRCNFCEACAAVCSAGAITVSGSEWKIDLGKCISCRRCMEACAEGSLELTEAPDYVLSREDLVFRSGESTERERKVIAKDKRRVFGRSLNVREVDTGSCNACEVEVCSMFNRFNDAERFGIKVVASPRHADILLVTGPLTDNMKEAFELVIDATPDPKVIVAMGTCAISGGLFVGGETSGGITDHANVDVFIPGCPPPPDAVIRALLGAFGLDGKI